MAASVKLAAKASAQLYHAMPWRGVSGESYLEMASSVMANGNNEIISQKCG